MARKRMAVPHPSVTGMAAGFSILDDLNKGDPVGKLIAGNATATQAIRVVGQNSQDLIKTQSGRTALLQAVGIAALGSWARRSMPDTKLGGTKFYFRI
jgi:hypothetical protein